MRAKNVFPLLYIYSYGKISLELCVFRTHPSHKMRQHGFYSKKSLWQSHFLSLSLSLSLSFFTLNSSTYSLKMQRVVTSHHTQWRIHTRYDSSEREISSSRRLYLTTDIQKKQTSTPPPGFKHEIAVSGLPTPTP